jgi:hypothetical protein
VLTRQSSDPAATDCAVEAAILHNWRLNVPLPDGEDNDGVITSDAGSDTDGDLGEFNWDLLEAGSGLSAWDQLGEGYERDAAKIGLSFSKIAVFVHS